MNKSIKSLIIIVVILFTVFLSACQISNVGSYNRGHWAYSDKESQFVNEIEIEWDSGDITINFVDDTQSHGIVVLCLSNIAQHETVHKIENNTLKIDFCSHKFHLGVQKSKWLEINIPKSLVSLKNIEIENSSGTVEINELSIDEVSIDMVSGSININKCSLNKLSTESVSSDIVIDSSTIKEIDIENVSGTVNASGTFKIIDLETVSGDVKITSDICPSKVEMDAVSSEIEILIPENDGFEVELYSTSGTLKIGFEVYVEKTWIYKDGGNKFIFDVVSSNINIKKLYK